MEDTCAAKAHGNLPVAGRITGNCIFLHSYTLRGKHRLGHSVWNQGKLSMYDPHSWLWNYVQISATECHGPKNLTLLKKFTTYAFGHVLTALMDRNLGELIVGIQTMYCNQLVNGAEHLPIKSGILARVYSTPPFIIEFVR